MKPRLLVLIVAALFSCGVSAQRVIPATEISKHTGDTITTCATVVAFTVIHETNISFLEPGGYGPGQTFMVIIPGADPGEFKQLSDTSLIGKLICITGKVTEFNRKPAIVVYHPKMTWVNQIAMLGGTDSSIHQHVKITNVVLAPPSNAQRFGEQYRSVSLAEISKNTTRDTISIVEAISGYKLTHNTAYIYFGAAYPNQKLTILLKGEAKQYFDAVLKIEYKGSDSLHVLDGKEFIGIGKITVFKRAPRMVIDNPSLLAVVPN